jgi:RNA polymerase sigma factor (sigma-70 family)
MESSTGSPFLDHRGKALPDRIQHVLDKLLPKLRRKFSTIRDDVVLVEILEQAGQLIADREVRDGPIERLYGFAWVTVRNVAISRLRRSPHLIELSTVGSGQNAAALSRLTAKESSPAAIERNVLLSQVLRHLSERERMIVIWKRAGRSSQEIANHLGMSASAVDTAYCRVRQKVQRLLR